MADCIFYSKKFSSVVQYYSTRHGSHFPHSHAFIWKPYIFFLLLFVRTYVHNSSHVRVQLANRTSKAAFFSLPLSPTVLEEFPEKMNGMEDFRVGKLTAASEDTACVRACVHSVLKRLARKGTRTWNNGALFFFIKVIYHNTYKWLLKTTLYILLLLF